MTSSDSKNILALFTLVFIAIFIAGAYFLFRWAITPFSSLDPQTTTISAIAAGTLLLYTLILSASIRWSSTQQNRDNLRLKQAEVYEKFLTVWKSELNGQYSSDYQVLER